MVTRKIIGTGFSLIGMLLGIIFVKQSDLNFDLIEYFDFSFKSYFSLSYFSQILPIVNCVILLYGGILLIMKPTRSNPVLALFGFTIMEEIAFHWLGLISITFPTYIIIVFFCSAVIALWIAYSDKINQEKLSLKEGISGLLLGTVINAFSYSFF